MLKVKYLAFCCIGEFISMYDFMIYVFLSPILQKIFFPNAAAEFQLLLVFGVFFLGFLSRPLGAFIFGHIGDTRGKARAFSWSTIIIGLPTLFIGFLPAYSAIGWLSPVLLTVFRITQGIAIGGEFTGSILFLSKCADEKNQCLIRSLCWLGALLGTLAGVLTTSVLKQLLSTAAIAIWGWRLPFWFGFIALFIGSYIRFSIIQSNSFSDVVKTKILRLPIRKVLSEKDNFFYVLGVNAQLAVLSYFTVIYMPIYINQFLGVTIPFSFLLSIGTLLLLIGLIPLFGLIGDRISSHNLLKMSSGFLVILVIPVFFLLTSKIIFYIILAQMILLILCAMAMAALPSVMIESTDYSVRYTAISLPYNIVYCVLGGSTPLLMTFIIHITGMSGMASLPLLVVSLITYITLQLRRPQISPNSSYFVA